MYRVLIIDDEAIIVDGLYELFQEVEHVELELYRAYSSREALELLDRLKMDVIFSDIRMPGLSGLELHEINKVKWPRCKVIFVTGYTDFEYVQTAIRNGSIDFILKTEGDEKVLQALDKAIASLTTELEADKFMEKAKRQMRLVLPMLQKDYLLGLIDGDRAPGTGRLRERFEELEISLDSEKPLLLLAGRIDEWPSHLSKTDKTLLLYAMENIIEEYFDRIRIAFVPYGMSKFCVLLQPSRDDWEIGGPALSEQLVSFIHGSIGSIQSTCKELLKLPISLIFSGNLLEWQRVAAKFADLTGSLYSGVGLGKEALLTEGIIHPPQYGGLPDDDHKLHHWIKGIRHLETYLESGQKDEYFKFFREMMQACSKYPVGQELRSEIYFSTALQLLRYFNRSAHRISGDIAVDKLMDFWGHSSWNEAMQYLGNTAELMFERKIKDQDERSEEIVTRLHQYINDHLDSELSLTKLAEVVYLNPVYLSRFYKQITGSGLSEYLTQARLQKAKELLRDTNYKIQDITGLVGFDSAAYFSRFFKKETNVTPQEYRDSSKI